MKVLAVVASVYCVLLAINCTQGVILYCKECGFDLGVFLLWVLDIALTGVGIYFILT